MINKKHYMKNPVFLFILKKWEERFGKEESEVLLANAVKNSNDFSKKYNNLPKK